MDGSVECGGGRRRSRGFRPQGWLGGSGGRDEVGRVQAKDLGCRGSEAKRRETGWNGVSAARVRA